jgi:hypothetical protein
MKGTEFYVMKKYWCHSDWGVWYLVTLNEKYFKTEYRPVGMLPKFLCWDLF